MRASTESISVRREMQTCIVRLNSQTYFTLEESKLQQLTLDLQLVAKDLSAGETLIVDLCIVEMFGSQFMRILIEQIKLLKKTGVDVILSGDQTGLLDLFRTDRWVTVVENVEKAMQMANKARQISQPPSAVARRLMLAHC